MSDRDRRRGPARAPAVIVGVAIVGATLLALPLASLLIEAPWARIGTVLAGDTVLDALRLSMITSTAAAAIAVIIGVPLAWVLARLDFKGRALLRGVVVLPMVLPPVVGGAALLMAFGRRGLVGRALFDATGLLLPFSLGGAIVAAAFIATPFVVLTVEGALRNLDPRYETAAASLGASQWTVLRHVTLPMLGPSLGAGALIAWARALGEFGATITFAGNLQGRTQTLPLAVFVALERDRDVAIALSVVLVAVSLVILLVLRDRWWPAR